MSDDASFIQAIQEDPEDLTCRLIYADWLDERNDPRGEYLRLECQQAEIAARLELLRQRLVLSWLIAVRSSRFKTEVLLQSGRAMSLKSLHQFWTYGGLLEGLPTTEMNQRLLDRLLEDERRKGNGEPYLIRPRETPILYRDKEPYPFGEPARLPSVICIGEFDSSPARDETRHASSLTVIWFQEEFAFPIDADILKYLRVINWEQHASDFDY